MAQSRGLRSEALDPYGISAASDFHWQLNESTWFHSDEYR
jgi:hypothetical protein